MQEKPYLRGDIYYADLGQGVGSEQRGYRQVLILQNNTGNASSQTVIVASIASKVGANAKLPTHHYIGLKGGLEAPSVVMLEQIRTIDKQRLDSYVGYLDYNEMQEVNKSLKVSLNLLA